MSDLIQIKSGSLGSKSAMPKLSEDELGYLKDKKELHIGTESGNVRLCGVDDISDIDAKIAEILAEIERIKAELASINT